MKTMFNNLKDRFKNYFIKFLEKRGFTVLTNKEYNEMVVFTEDYKTRHDIDVEDKTLNDLEQKVGNSIDIDILRVKEIMDKIHNRDYTIDLITSQPNKEVQTELAKHINKVMELLDGEKFKKGALKEIQKKREIGDLQKSNKFSYPKEVDDMMATYKAKLMEERTIENIMLSAEDENEYSEMVKNSKLPDAVKAVMLKSPPNNIKNSSAENANENLEGGKEVK